MVLNGGNAPTKEMNSLKYNEHHKPLKAKFRGILSAVNL
ncbi:Hypothetical protein ABZS17G119_01393 [Kosakonia cowanii]|jgi:hypothetical protein